MPADGDAHVVARDLRPQAAGDERQVLLQRDVDPAALVGRFRALERHVPAGLGQAVVLLPGDFLQLILRSGEGAFGGDHGRRRGVACRLGFLHIGDGDEPHLEALVGLIELAGDGFEGRLVGFQPVLGGEHVEVGLRDAQDQLLLGGLVGGLRLGDLAPGPLERHPVRPREQVLPQIYGPRLGGRIQNLRRCGYQRGAVRARAEKGLLAPVVVARGAGGAVELRQQRSPGLGASFARREPVGIGLADDRVVVHRVFEHPYQILGGRAAGKRE